MKKPLIPLALAALALTSCSSAISDDGAYSDTAALRDAFVEAGGRCTEDGSVGSSRLLRCDPEVILHVVDNDADLDVMAEAARLSNRSVLRGDNWFIESERASRITSASEELGGALTTGRE